MHKNELRKLALEKRLRYTKAQVDLLSKSISDLFFLSFDLSKINYLHIFLSIENKNEINTEFILERLQRDFPKIKLVISKTEFYTNKMTHFIFDQNTKLLKSNYGIPEPEEGIMVSDESIDLVLIPLLAFDRKGNRIGYGKGIYDRFLLNCRPDCKKVGLSFEGPIENIDSDKFDIALDLCITPDLVINF